MADIRHVATFDAGSFEGTIRAMRASGEKAHDKGKQVYQDTGQLDSLVNIFGERRVSRNAMARDGDVFRLPHGPKLPILMAMDGTGSMGENIARALKAMKIIDAMLEGVRNWYQTDVSVAVMQDVGDIHPVFQMAQFESDERFAEHVRLLVPDGSGGDAPEDYDLGLAYVWMATETDIWDFYRLRGYLMIVGDQVGRGKVYPDAVQRHLGHTLQSAMSTRDICKQLLEKWHLYFVQVGSGGSGGTQGPVTNWWGKRLESDRVIVVPNPNWLAEVQAGLVYVTETEQPTRDGLVNFLLAGGQNVRISESEVHEIWNWLQAAQPHFGAQTRQPGYGFLPKPGDTFAHYRHAWPIGHSREDENVTPDDAEAPVAMSDEPDKDEPDEIDWGNF